MQGTCHPEGNTQKKIQEIVCLSSIFPLLCWNGTVRMWRCARSPPGRASSRRAQWWSHHEVEKQVLLHLCGCTAAFVKRWASFQISRECDCWAVLFYVPTFFPKKGWRRCIAPKLCVTCSFNPRDCTSCFSLPWEPEWKGESP